MEGFEGKLGEAFVGRATCENGAAGEGREVELLAHFELLLGEAVEVVVAGELDARGVGGEGLDDDFAFEFAATGAAGDLGEELEDAFAGTEVGDVEADVGVKDADQGDVGKVEAFGDHLGADEDVDLLGLEGIEEIAEGIFFAHGVGVDAGDAGGGEYFFQDVFDFLGAEALEEDAVVAAFGAFAWDDRLMAADVAEQAVVGAMVGERDGAVRAFADMAA